jgi:5'-nucleotidase
VNSYLADGGDNFSVLKAGINRKAGSSDIDAFVNYFKAFSPVAPGPRDRISLVKDVYMS